MEKPSKVKGYFLFQNKKNLKSFTLNIKKSLDYCLQINLICDNLSF